MLARFEFLIAAGLDKDPSILVTDDPAPMSREDATVNPEGGRVFELSTHRETALERPFLRIFLGRAPGTKVQELSTLRKTAFVSEGTPITGHEVDGDLRIGDLGALEVQMGVRARTAGLPKSFAEM